MILNINQLRAFHAAAKLKSITLAAQELMVTPPAISMQVKQLEEALEIKLMFRNGNSIQLTEVGHTIFKRCDRIFKQIKDMEDFLEDISTAKSGVLKIGCPQTPAKYVVPRLIAEFNKTGFTGGMKMKYKNNTYDVISVDFEEELFAYSLDGDFDNLSWARCENVELI